MRVVAFVPMKLVNERLPGKNTKIMSNGKPLCHFILETLRRVPEIDETYVYCSDEAIIPHLPEGAATFLKRDPVLDDSSALATDFIQYFAKDVHADIYVLAHATTPFLSVESIQKGISAVVSGEYDSAFAVCKMQEFLWDAKGEPNYDVRHIPRTQDITPVYKETTGLYIYKNHVVRDMRRRIGSRPFMVEVSAIEATDIDYPLDFDIANALIRGGLVPSCS